MLGFFFSYFCARDFLYFAIGIYSEPLAYCRRYKDNVVLHFIMNNKISDKNNISSLIGRIESLLKAW